MMEKLKQMHSDASEDAGTPIRPEDANVEVASASVEKSCRISEDREVKEMHVAKDGDHSGIVDKIYELRANFLIIGLTGRTGSGCSTVARMLEKSDFDSQKSNYNDFHYGQISNQDRKDRIVYKYLKHNWHPFFKIKVSDLIYLFALKHDFEEFIGEIKKTLRQMAEKVDADTPTDDGKRSDERVEGKAYGILNVEDLEKDFLSLREDYEVASREASELLHILEIKGYEDGSGDEKDIKRLESHKEFISKKLPRIREKIETVLRRNKKGSIPRVLQSWGDNIRMYGDIKSDAPLLNGYPDTLIKCVNRIIKLIRRLNNLIGSLPGENRKDHPTLIVVDALRNPFEILYLRERYSGFYCMSVNTPKDVRHDKLLKDLKLGYDEILTIDEKENESGSVYDSFVKINLNSCIQLSDIFLCHDGTPAARNFNLINQLFTYISLMFHPGLVTPSPQERLMQIAYTAKLNSGCLSRQVGAAITDSNFSVKAVGWNSSPAGTVPCNLRRFEDLYRNEDREAYSDFERTNPKFRDNIIKLEDELKLIPDLESKLNGIGFPYCFKDIYTSYAEKQKHNQVHTRALHAEENAFLQLSKYGAQGIEGGKLFSTASCCELCAKKAYHLGIKEIYYIDSYPGISEEHVLGIGSACRRPKMILFSGCVGRAYVSLYNPFMPLKDELSARTGVNVKNVIGRTSEEKYKIDNKSEESLKQSE